MIKQQNKNHTTPLLQITNLSKQFLGANYKTLSDINLTIYEGEFFALLGPSGCGKTTLMRMISGFEPVAEGRIFLEGKDITDIPPFLRPVNMMFQSYALFPHMNVEENIAFGLKQEHLPKDEIRNRVNETLEILKMGEYKKRKPRELSGGQQQRVALARSLVKRPKLILLDEPLGALDRKTREHTRMELIKIQKLLGVTFIIVTHDQEEAMSLADRVAVMNHGELLQIGTPEEVYEVPNSRFVADFVGPVNIFPGTIKSIDADKRQVTIKSEEVNIDIQAPYKPNLQVGQQVWTAVRPEEIDIYTSIVNDYDNFLQAKLLDIAFLGSDTIYTCEASANKVVQVSLPSSAKSRNLSITVGNNIYLSWCPTDGVILTN